VRVKTKLKIPRKEFYERTKELRQTAKKFGCEHVSNQTATMSSGEFQTATSQRYWEKAIAALIPNNEKPRWRNLAGLFFPLLFANLGLLGRWSCRRIGNALSSLIETQAAYSEI
jgi:hypothetical protein